MLKDRSLAAKFPQLTGPFPWKSTLTAKRPRLKISLFQVFQIFFVFVADKLQQLGVGS